MSGVRLRYLYHSGVAVETANHLLVFDYWRDGTLTGGVPALAAACGKPLTVFVSHRHPDHLSRRIFDWRTQLPRTTYVLSDDCPAFPDCMRIGPGETLEAPGMTVSALRSTDEGVAFVVGCDGAAVYHAGDLNWWHWEGEPDRWNHAMAAAYRAEIEKLSGVRLDAAFVPVDGRLGDACLRGIELFARLNDCPRLIPIHFSSDPSVLRRLEETDGPWQGRLLILDDARPEAAFDLP